MNANTHSTTVIVAISERCSINIAGLLLALLRTSGGEKRTLEDVQTPLVSDCQRPANSDRKDGEQHEINDHRATHSGSRPILIERSLALVNETPVLT
jgi:hypothetical protein